MPSVGCGPTLMKNPTTALTLVLLAIVAALLWRLERHSAVLAELARVQLADRVEHRRAEADRIAAAQRAEAEARAQAEATAAAAEQRARDEAARLERLREPVQPGEVVPTIRLDNGDTVHGAVVVALQPTSVSFKVGARLYNIPTEDLPAELRERLRRMFPAPAAGEVAPAPQP